ncbi:SOS response-associated protein YedK [Eubacterium callanderi]|uniref:SOS response-associated peptidase n=1 Tax=Eubacterium callanderi TaxID=53442 RepID=UPI0029FEEC50|nr:SOS response-associated peptidase [Eubacterium callanderi]WPK69897.1 SOS response-associated protein YedK [Eubacterium callanderi]WPK74195.1 SOS response-associated protein YedK [Eubacterium callanderi]
MCGRYVLYTSDEIEEINAIIQEVNNKHHIQLKKGDIYPTNTAPVYAPCPDHNGMSLELMKWGYEKHLKKKTLLINARSETVLEKTTFKNDFLERRCLIPAAGFYEWNVEKEKFMFTGDSHLIYLGGFYHKDKDRQEDFVIMTKSPVDPVAEIHNRMPVIIPKANASDWLYNTDDAIRLMRSDLVNLKRERIS